MKINAKTKICMVIGDPVEHSLSPVIHNAGYEAAQIDDQFVYVAAKVAVDSIPDFINGVRVMGIRGVSCTVPHKEVVLPYLDFIDPLAEKIGAVNTIVNENGKLIGYNTDWLGIIHPLKQRTDIKDRRVVVLGAGGAARAAVFGLTREGAQVIILNRTVEKAQKLAEEFSCTFGPLNDTEALQNAHVIINTTKVGMVPDVGFSPIAKAFMNPEQFVFDSVYAPYETQLLKDANEQGATIIHGTEMLLEQAMAQFLLYTKHEAPKSAMEQALRQALAL